jgi:hypothetical protein
MNVDLVNTLTLAGHIPNKAATASAFQNFTEIIVQVKLCLAEFKCRKQSKI